MSARGVKKIQDFDRFYWLLRYYVDSALKLSYRSIVYVGTENIPKDGAIIYAPNHTNALMDALVVLAIDRKPKVFVARADIFRNRRLAKIFTFLKIMPIMRLRDGFNEVKKNQETISKAVDVLKDKIPFCIFPEGTHQAKYSSLPLSKGIFRIAFQAQEMMPDMPLYIIPTGIRYGNFFRFRSTVRVQIGSPINVGEFMAEHADLTPQEQMNRMKDLLAERIHSSIFYMPDDQDYKATYEICNVAHSYEVDELQKQCACKKRHNLDLLFEANNNTIKRIATLKESDPQTAQRLLELGHEANALRKSKGICTESISVRESVTHRTLRALLLLITLPYTVVASLLTTPVVGVCKYLFTKLKDPAFKNSAWYLAYLLLWPVLVIIYSVVTFLLLPWQWALPVVLLIIPAPIVAHELWYSMRVAISEIKLRKERRLRELYAQIMRIITRNES